MSKEPARLFARDFAIGVSLANLLFTRTWAELFIVGQPQAYYLKLGSQEFLAAALDVILLGLLFATGASARHWGGTAGRRVVAAGFVAVMCVLASNLGPLKSPGLLHLIPVWRDGHYAALAAIAVAAVGAIAALVKWRTRVRRVVVTGLLVLSPFAFLNLGRCAYYVIAFHPDTRFADRTPPLGSGEDAPDGPRVIVLLFDAMGRALAITDRKPGVEMPALDRLRAEAFEATNVTQVGQNTKFAVPGLLTGRQVKTSKPAGIDNLTLKFADGHTEDWSELDNLFREARALGGRSTAVGWYHPYCRVLAKDLSDCSWHPSYMSGGRSRPGGLAVAMTDSLAAAFPYTVYRRRQLLSYQAIRADGEAAITRPGAGITLVHINIPHSPYIFDHRSKRLTVTNFRTTTGYVGALLLADKTLAELREAMERAGTWDSSTVLVTSDHAANIANVLYKMKDVQVPVILKLPGQKAGAVYDKPFSATGVHGLLRGALRGEIRTESDATAWLDANIANHPVLESVKNEPIGEEP